MMVGGGNYGGLYWRVGGEIIIIYIEKLVVELWWFILESWWRTYGWFILEKWWRNYGGLL